MRKLLIILFLIVITALPVSAALYKWKDENGAVHFSDTRPSLKTKYKEKKEIINTTQQPKNLTSKFSRKTISIVGAHDGNSASVARKFNLVFGIAAPEIVKGALAINYDWLKVNRPNSYDLVPKMAGLFVFIPTGMDSAAVFSRQNNTLNFDFTKTTVMLAGKFYDIPGGITAGGRGLTSLVSSNTNQALLKRSFIDTGMNKIPTYDYIDSPKLEIRFVYLEGARIIMVIGPKKNFNTRLLILVARQLANKYQNDSLLKKHWPNPTKQSIQKGVFRKKTSKEVKQIRKSLLLKLPSIQILMKDESIRLATMADVENWAKIAKRKPGNLYWHASKSAIESGEAFVILKPIELSNDLRTKFTSPLFFVPQGVPNPVTKMQKYAIFKSDGSCSMDCP